MKNTVAYQLAEKAFQNKELEKLLLGEGQYDYLPKYSPAPGNTDLAEIIPNGVFPYLADNSKIENVNYLNTTLNTLCNSLEGMYSVACFILLYHSYFDKLQVLKKIVIKNVIESLSHNIQKHKSELLKSKSILGASSNFGLYGVLKTLSKNTVELGGPSFFPEESYDSSHQEKEE